MKPVFRYYKLESAFKLTMKTHFTKQRLIISTVSFLVSKEYLYHTKSVVFGIIVYGLWWSQMLWYSIPQYRVPMSVCLTEVSRH